MDRNAFLKAVGATFVGGLVAQTALAASPKGVTQKVTTQVAPIHLWQFYGTGDGKIFVKKSHDDEWTLHSNFGAGCCIYTVYHSGRDVFADISHKSERFTVQLTQDGKYWIKPKS